MKICHCGKKAVLSEDDLVDAPADWQATKAWHCGRCGGISHAYQEPGPIMRAPANATALLHAVHHLDGSRTLTWAMPQGRVDTCEFFPWPRRHPMTEREPLIYLTWELLMSKVKVILAEPNGPSDNAIEADNRERARYEARGIAEVLALQMKPFMESADHVVKCAVKAYKDPEFDVPGLAKFLWDPMHNADGSLRTPVAAPKQKPAARPKPKPAVDNKSTRKLSPEEAEGIKDAVSSGMFSKEDVASMFKVSLATVEEAIA